MRTLVGLLSISLCAMACTKADPPPPTQDSQNQIGGDNGPSLGDPKQPGATPTNGVLPNKVISPVRPLSFAPLGSAAPAASGGAAAPSTTASATTTTPPSSAKAPPPLVPPPIGIPAKPAVK